MSWHMGAATTFALQTPRKAPRVGRKRPHSDTSTTVTRTRAHRSSGSADRDVSVRRIPTVAPTGRALVCLIRALWAGRRLRARPLGSAVGTRRSLECASWPCAMDVVVVGRRRHPRLAQRPGAVHAALLPLPLPLPIHSLLWQIDGLPQSNRSLGFIGDA